MKKSKRRYDFVLYYVFMSVVLFVVCVHFAKIEFESAEKELIYASATLNASDDSQKSKITVILDAGHGGEDAGAVSESGILEKDLNLLICEQIYDILRLYDVDVVMTRTEDKLLYTEEQNIKGQRKNYDLKNRYLIACEYENAVFVSIHMNKFTQSQYRGLQVYYSQNNENSRILAADIQKSVAQNLQTYNKREIKAANSSIYLLDRLNCTAVLVECGFLSNGEDTELLCDPTYRTQLSFLIADMILKNTVE